MIPDFVVVSFVSSVSVVSKKIVIRNRKRAETTETTETTEKKVVPDFVVVSFVSVVSVISLLRITLSYVILIPLYTHGRTVIYIGKMTD